MLKAHDSVLVIAAHPDDEVLGCGGTMARLAAMGAQVSILILSPGAAARAASPDSQERVAGEQAELRRAAEQAAGLLGARPPVFCAFPDNRLDSVPLLDITQAIEALAGEIQPTLVFTHHSGDCNQDHVLVNRAVMAAFRPLPGRSPVTVLAFEVPSSTEYAFPCAGSAFTPNVFVDIAATGEAKANALRAYASEMRPWPHPRSLRAVESLAMTRGSQVGREAAEAFMLLRHLEG